MMACAKNYNDDSIEVTKSSSSQDSEYFSCEEDDNCSKSISWTIDIAGNTNSRGKKVKIKRCIPRQVNKSNIFNEDVQQRKFLNIKRLYCISRPQYKRSCGASAVVSVWNYLFSTLGEGKLPPVSQEEAITRFGFSPPFGEIRFGPTTGNSTLMRWFRVLCDAFGVRSRCYIVYKPVGLNVSRIKKEEEALEVIKKGLRGDSVGFIYHCYNHYFCPIGYEESSGLPEEAYTSFSYNYNSPIVSQPECPQTGDTTPPEDMRARTWIFVAETSKKCPPLHCFDWQDIVRDLKCRSPEFLNIRKLSEGIQTRSKKVCESPIEEITFTVDQQIIDPQDVSLLCKSDCVNVTVSISSDEASKSDILPVNLPSLRSTSPLPLLSTYTPFPNFENNSDVLAFKLNAPESTVRPKSGSSLRNGNLHCIILFQRID